MRLENFDNYINLEVDFKRIDQKRYELKEKFDQAMLESNVQSFIQANHDPDAKEMLDTKSELIKYDMNTNTKFNWISTNDLNRLRKRMSNIRNSLSKPILFNLQKH